ncbi:PepSY-like domain-containing protein [Gillisia sp. JM1]|uniref:PepSY-like domain-containing protein n=1 Tax=Gillisia sp. JM1 TaxID=1283286 RepID=UPI000411A234|nr:PepSY-like domain-containing protein [Gillisia sp. JM1]
MKIIKAFLSVLLSIGLFAFGTVQGDIVPKKVKEAFQKKFPTAYSVDWEKESETEWEAEFRMNKVEYSANFLEDGTWKETEHELSEKDIPKNIYNSLMTEFPGYEIEEAEISETEAGTFYEFEIEKGKSVMEVFMTMEGKITKKDVVDEDED